MIFLRFHGKRMPVLISIYDRHCKFIHILTETIGKPVTKMRAYDEKIMGEVIFGDKNYNYMRIAS